MRRLGRLDGLRGIAACGVAFLYHTQQLFVPGSFNGEPAVLGWLHVWGWSFVDLFFLISGYIFAHVYLDGKLSTREGLASFAVARFARLYPLHLVTLLVCAALFWYAPANNFFSFFANLFMLQGFLGMDERGFNGPSWSITVEIVCYILFAVAAYSGRRALWLVTIAAIVLSLCHFAVLGHPDGGWDGEAIPRALLGFFVGQVLWHMRERIAHVPTLVFVGIMAFGFMLDMGEYSSIPRLSMLVWPALMIIALRLPLMESRPMIWLGDRSYAIYLVHQPIAWSLTRYTGRMEGDPAFIIGVHLAYIAVTLLAADIAMRIVEVPARDRIRRVWAARRKRESARRSAALER
ncbi:MAG: acyltransferase [Novosphingobium sp.]|nr:acyltransferase [Novosphingobium sp.]MCP5401247.1 acyltransferase [Novosphingobium sp.]